MNPIRLAAALAGLAGALLAFAAAAPAALASGQPPHPPPGWNKHPPLPAHIQTAAATGGMPGWQVTLIAAATVVLAAALAVMVYRIRAARRRVTASTAQVHGGAEIKGAAAKTAHHMTRRI